ncbi:sarcolemmal membrane-associated protein [Eurosta solidaginis]|uniref:sarcolemmal membrane-associated protein n=1 Tax=Eurosta solidaginis TaxID=178769 RepID=UPI003531138D
MVLASNEWLNNCEDDQRSTTTTGNTPTATTNAQAAGNREIGLNIGTIQQVATTATTAQTATNTSSITTLAVTPSTSVATTITRTASANNEIMSENLNNELHQSPQQQQQVVKQQKNFSGDGLTTTTAAVVELKNSPHTQEIVNNNSEVLNCDTPNTTNTNTPNSNSNIKYLDTLLNSGEEIVGNSGIISSNADEVASIINNTHNANLFSNPSSNASTLQSALGRQTKETVSALTAAASTVQTVASLLPLSSPITPQALSNALQSVMNASNNTTNVTVTTATVGNLQQNNFLSSFGIDIGGSGGGTTAKELSAAFCSGLVEAQQANLSNNINAVVQNVGSSSNLSINLEGVENNGQAKIVLICESNSHPFQTRTIQLTPNIECKVGRLIAKSKASESNAIFDCKVLSRNHAVLWYTDDGKFWVKDTKSSNGTFINENKLGTEAAELHFGDIVKFGVDVLENSRKEVHGCIIAFVKLFMPDGREAISIDTTTQRSQYSGEGRISYEEIHRLNLYMQEVSQREKALKSKLFNIQNVLDATRKNSALCWQSLIAEDQLLHRINSLEKKLQIMEKNVPDSALRNEVLKLLEDKSSYQLTAKEALRKVYQERCDALQMLSKMELAYENSDGECKILRDQIMNTKQSLQDVNTRLQRLETDYNEYKGEAERKQQEIKEQDEQRIAEMTEKLQQREMECDELRRRVSEIMLQRAELNDEEEKKLELQAIEKLDAAIGAMDLGEDDEEDDEEGFDNEDDANNERKAIGDEADGEHKEDGNEKDFYKKVHARAAKNAINGGSRKSLNSSDEIEILNTSPEADAVQKRIKKKGSAKQSTILKWLQNSDMNEKEGSIDIFKAICNESDSSDEQDIPLNEINAGLDSESGIDTNTISAEEIKLKYKKSKNQLQSVQTLLCQLVEAELSKDCYKSEECATVDEQKHKENEALDSRRKENECISTKAMDDGHKLLLLQRSVAMLSEAYKEITESLNDHDSLKATFAEDLHTQFQNYATLNTGVSTASKMLNTQDTLMPLAEVAEEEMHQDKESMQQQLLESDECHSEECTTTATTPCTIVSASVVAAEELKLRNEIHAYQEQIEELNCKLEQVESDAQNTLEIMQIECDSYREKVAQLTKVLQKACEEKQEFKRLLDERINAEVKQERPAEPVKSAEPAAQKINMTKDLVEECINEATTKVPETQSSSCYADVPVVVTHLSENKESEAHNSNSASLLLQQCTASTNSTSGIGMLLLDVDDFETQLSDDLAAISNSALQREEELIVYKERLEKTQNDNLQLRNEIAALLLKSGTQAQSHMIKQMLAYGTVAAAIIIYFITMYF